LLPLFGQADTVYCAQRSAPQTGDGTAKVIHAPLDLSEPWDLSALPQQADTVVHLAQSAHYREFPDRAGEVFQVNTASTAALLDYARRAGAGRFVLASSGGVYGAGGKPFTEQDQMRPAQELGFYLGTKYCSEVLAESYAGLFDVVVVRFFFVYGPGQRDSALIPRLVQSIAQGRPVTLHGHDGLRLNPIHAEDAAQALRACLDLPGGAKINIGGPEVLSLRSIAELIGQRLGRAPVFETLPHNAAADIVGDIGVMTCLLGPPRLAFAQGLDRYLASIKF